MWARRSVQGCSGAFLSIMAGDWKQPRWPSEGDRPHQSGYNLIMETHLCSWLESKAYLHVLTKNNWRNTTFNKEEKPQNSVQCCLPVLPGLSGIFTYFLRAFAGARHWGYTCDQNKSWLRGIYNLMERKCTWKYVICKVVIKIKLPYLCLNLTKSCEIANVQLLQPINKAISQAPTQYL